MLLFLSHNIISSILYAFVVLIEFQDQAIFEKNACMDPERFNSQVLRWQRFIFIPQETLYTDKSGPSTAYQQNTINMVL